MRSARDLLLPVLLVVAGSFLARAEDKILVRSDPPLTASTVKRYQEKWQWYNDVALTPEQCRQHQAHFIRFWATANKVTRQGLLASYARSDKLWRETQKLPAAEREAKRLEYRIAWLNVLRKSKNDVDRYLVAVYDAAYKPGGTKNPILVDSDPPLTKVLMDQRRLYVQWLLGLKFSDKEWQDYQTLFIKGWDSASKDKKKPMVKIIQEWGEWLPQQAAYYRNLMRALHRPVMEVVWQKSPYPGDRWLLAWYRAAHKVGGRCNLVLVEGASALTQGMVDSYGDYLEWAIDLSVGGGFTSAQRDVLKDYLVADWKRMSPEQKKAFQDALAKWDEVIHAAPDKRRELHGALQPKVLAQLRGATDERSRWLMGVCKQEEQLRALRREMERARHESVMAAIRAMMPTGEWVWDSRYGYRWVER
jgi:hypothetical protein